MLRTEMRNQNSMHIDTMDTLSMVRLMNQEKDSYILNQLIQELNLGQLY